MTLIKALIDNGVAVDEIEAQTIKMEMEEAIRTVANQSSNLCAKENILHEYDLDPVYLMEIL